MLLELPSDLFDHVVAFLDPRSHAALGLTSRVLDLEPPERVPVSLRAAVLERRLPSVEFEDVECESIVVGLRDTYFWYEETVWHPVSLN